MELPNIIIRANKVEVLMCNVRLKTTTKHGPLIYCCTTLICHKENDFLQSFGIISDIFDTFSLEFLENFTRNSLEVKTSTFVTKPNFPKNVCLSIFI